MEEDYTKEKYWKLVQEFVHELKTAKYWLKNDGKPKKEWKLYDTRAAALSAAWGAVSNEKKGTVKWKRVWCYAWNAGYDEAEHALNVVWDAAWNVSQDVDWDVWEKSRVETHRVVCEAASEAENAVLKQRLGSEFDMLDAHLCASWNVKRDVNRDVALYAMMLNCRGMSIDKKHLDHVSARMEVWRKGYGLLCDINGVLYVYRGV